MFLTEYSIAIDHAKKIHFQNFHFFSPQTPSSWTLLTLPRFNKHSHQIEVNLYNIHVVVFGAYQKSLHQILPSTNPSNNLFIFASFSYFTLNPTFSFIFQTFVHFIQENFIVEELPLYKKHCWIFTIVFNKPFGLLRKEGKERIFR